MYEHERRTQMKKRILSLLLSLIMVLSLLPTTAWAASDGTKLSKLGWKYAVISDATHGYSVRTANGSEDLSQYVTVKVNGTTLTRGTASSFSIASENDTTPVTVSAVNGYYVAYVVLCCNDNGGYNCKTSRSDNALGFTGNMDGSDVTTTLGALYARTPHKMGTAYGPGNPYWLMVMLAPIPNPVYVGYDAGTAGSTPINAAPVVKDTASDGGTWEDSLYVKKYPTTNGAPDHTVLGISDAAVNEAAAIKTTAAPYGYSFDGWKLAYYVSYNNGSFTGETDAGQGGKKAAGDTITLFTHAKLVAQWKANDAPPAPTTGNLTINKTVSGITNNDKEFSFTVTDADGSTVDGGTFTLKNGETKTLTLPLGTYTVTETGANVSDITGYTLETKYNDEVRDSYNVTLTNEADASAADGSRTCRPNPDPDPTPTTPTTPTTPSATVIVTNTYTPVKTSVAVQKVWDNTDGSFTAPKAGSVTVKLMNGTTEVDSATLTEACNWTHTFPNLPTHDNSSNEINYTVKEAAVDGYTGTVTGSAANGYTITNTPNWDDDTTVTPATLTVVKVKNGTTTPLAGAKFKLYDAQNSLVGTEKTTGADGTITFENLTAGTYTLEETKAPAGYAADEMTRTITIGAGTKSVDPIYDTDNTTVIGYKKHITYADANATVSNTMKVEQTNRVEPATLTIKKVDSADSNKTLTGAKFQLTNGTTTLISTDNKNGTYTITGINADGAWTLTEVEAPTGYDKGNWSKTIQAKHTTSEPMLDEAKDIYYRTDTYAIEKSNDYDPANDTLVIENTRSTTSVSVEKVWKGDEENQELRPTSITVNLMNGATVVDTKELTAENNWKATFEDVRKYDDNNALIDYTVVEAPVANYKAGVVTPDNNGGYTITNELAPTEYTATVDIEKIVKKTGGNVAPGKEEFVFVAYYEGTEKNVAVGEAKIITDGERTYTSEMVLTVPASAFKLDNNGNGTVTLYVSEISGASAGWTYDPTVYTLVMTVENYAFAGIKSGDEIEFTPIIGSVPDGQGSDGASTNITLKFTNEFSQTKTPNRPHKPGKPITSVKTGDAGVAMYAMSGLLSLGGAALFMKKRKDEE